MKQKHTILYVYWDDAYGLTILPYCKDGIMINISCRIFTSLELRSFKNAEIIFLPKDKGENECAEVLLNQCDRYGVVGLIKKPFVEGK